MNHRTTLASFALALLALTPSCASAPPAPDAFTLVVQIGRDLGQDRITLDNVDSLQLLFTPVMEGMRTARFVMPMQGSFEDGEITMSVDANGLLTMVVSRDYILANAVPDATGGNPRLELELWTADTAMHAGPQVRATVIHQGDQIGIGTLTLADWPLPPGGEGQITVPCMTGLSMLCTAAP